MTTRETIEGMLKKREMSAHELAEHLGIPIGEVTEDLKHIRLSNRRSFIISPPKCKDCGFIFTKEGKVATPSKCPKCNSERVNAPSFSIKE